MNLTAKKHSVPLNDGNSMPLIGLGTYGDPRTVRLLINMILILLFMQIALKMYLCIYTVHTFRYMLAHRT